MTVSSGPARSGRSAALGRALLDARRTATTASEALLNLVPDTGDHATGRLVDDFVEQASDAMRALAESLGHTVEGLGAAQPSSADRAAGDRSGHDGGHRRWVP